MTCPKCGNSDPELIAPMTEGGSFDRASQERHERGAPKQMVKLLGSKCLLCLTYFELN